MSTNIFTYARDDQVVSLLDPKRSIYINWKSCCHFTPLWSSEFVLIYMLGHHKSVQGQIYNVHYKYSKPPCNLLILSFKYVSRNYNDQPKSIHLHFLCVISVDVQCFTISLIWTNYYTSILSSSLTSLTYCTIRFVLIACQCYKMFVVEWHVV